MSQFSLIPPPGVAINQWKDGSLHFNADYEQIILLRDRLLALAEQLHVDAIKQVEQARQEEQDRLAAPPSQLEVLERELARLKKLRR